MRYLTITLTLLLALVHVELWFGSNGVSRVLDLDTRLQAQRAANEVHREGNERMAAEVRDLRDGLEMVEEKARFELGMIRPDEILVQISAAKP